MAQDAPELKYELMPEYTHQHQCASAQSGEAVVAPPIAVTKGAVQQVQAAGPVSSSTTKPQMRAKHRAPPHGTVPDVSDVD